MLDIKRLSIEMVSISSIRYNKDIKYVRGRRKRRWVNKKLKNMTHKTNLGDTDTGFNTEKKRQSCFQGRRENFVLKIYLFV